jgi:hypothetical protein
MKDWVVFVIVGAIYIATLTVLVRPNSKLMSTDPNTGHTYLTNIFNAFDDLVRGSLGESFDSNTKKWVPASK